MSADDKYSDLSRPLRVALLYTSERRISDLAKVLENNGLTIAGRYKISAPALETVANMSADVILVDLDESAEQVLDVLEGLLESAQLPILFNDNATTDFVVNTANPEWGHRLAGKLWTLAKRRPPMPVAKPPARPRPEARVEPKPQPKPKMPLPAAARSNAVAAPRTPPKPAERPRAAAAPGVGKDPVQELWVLGASLGGPLAVREFLGFLPDDLPVAFVLAQHIGASHLDLLAEQLDRITPLKVSVASAGMALKPNEVLLAPVDHRVVIDGQARVLLEPKGESIYGPCIDFVMEDMAQRFRERCCAIIFSGMGNDGERGCHAVGESGGTVWAQEPESCVISSMPDNARKTGYVTFNGTPEALARELIKRYRSKSR
jgi:chemosensory pili system protein ChpB (putative protein-glutamate methylesterase)